MDKIQFIGGIRMQKDDKFKPLDSKEHKVSDIYEPEVDSKDIHHPTEDEIFAELQTNQNEPQTQHKTSTPIPPEPTKEILEADKGYNEIQEPHKKISEASSPSLPKSQSVPPSQLQPELPAEGESAIKVSIEQMGQDIKTLVDASTKITSEVREIHKLYHNEYASRLKSMQDKIEWYQEIEKGRIFDGILGEVAKLYTDYESMLDVISEEKVRKGFTYMLDDIVQILEANGVSKQKSKERDKRNTRHCRVIERVLTNTAELHDTIARSRGTGFYIENRSLIKEPVDIYLYSQDTDSKSDEI